MNPLPTTDDPAWADLRAQLAEQDDPVVLVRADQARRWESGSGSRVESYIALLPTITDEDALVLIMAEVQLRRERGDEPTLAEYQERFPGYRADLAVQFQFSQAVRDFATVTARPDSQATLNYRPDARPELPKAIPGFDVIEPIGQGAMGVVFRARQIRLNRIVALKMVLGGDLAGPKELIRFLAEAESVAAVRHANVVQVYEFGESNGRPFLAMEYLSGGSLADCLRTKGRFTPNEAASLIRTLAFAVQAAHDLGIVHRDLKPANVLFDEAGSPKITDFGLAKRTGGSDLTATDAIMGTPAYMSPEQAKGAAKYVGPPADVHGLGVILYECLAGTRPFDDPDPIGLLRQVAEMTPPSVRSRVADVPRDLDLICQKCLAKEPTDRYSSAKALADDLDAFLNGRPIAARPIGSVVRAWRWSRRNPWTATLIGSVVCLILLVAIGSSVGAVVLRAQRDQARDAEDRAREAERTRRQQLYKAYIGEARAVRGSGRVGQRYRGLDAIREILKAVPPDELSDEQRAELRDEAIASLALPDVRIVSRKPSLSSGAFDLDCDASLNQFILSDRATQRTIVRDSTGARPDELLPVVPSDVQYRYIQRQMSPTGRFVAEIMVGAVDIRQSRFRIWDREVQKFVFDSPNPLNWATKLDWHPQRLEAIVEGSNGLLQVMDLTTGQRLSEAKRRFAYGHARYSPDGKLLAVTNGLASPQILDASTLEEVEASPQVTESDGLAWSPDGGSIAFGTASGQVYIWNRPYRYGRYLPGRHGGVVFDVRFSADGTLLATSGMDNVTRLWNPNGNQLLLTVPGRIIRFSKDGRRFIAADDRDLIEYEYGAGDGLTVIREGVEGATYSPDGAYLTLFDGRGVRFLAADTHAKVGEIELDDCGTVAFRPDGGALVTITRFTGAWIWPERIAGGTLHIGPPNPSPPEKGFGELFKRFNFDPPVNDGRHAAWSGDSKVLIIPDRRERVLNFADPEAKKQHRLLAKMHDPDFVEVSRDGRWIAAASTDFQGTRVFDPAGNSVVHADVHGAIAFDPGGRWFATAGRMEAHVYRVDGWEKVRSFPRDEVDPHCFPALAFQPGTGLLAMSTSRTQIRLFDPESGATAATLTHPDPGGTVELRFSPDGGRLAVTRAGLDVSVWDFRRLAIELRELGLDAGRFGDLPAAKPILVRPIVVERGPRIPLPSTASTRWRNIAWVEATKKNYPGAIVDGTRAIDSAGPDPKWRGKLHRERGEFHWHGGSFTAARDDWQIALSLDPTAVEPIVWLARLWALGPPEVQDPQRAIALGAPLAKSKDPPTQLLLALAAAELRLGRPREALLMLEALKPDTGPVRDYLMASCQALLGERKSAEESFARGRSAEAKPARELGDVESAEITRVRSDAEEALRGGRK